MARSVSRLAGLDLGQPTVPELSLGEQLLIWAFRKRLEGESRAATVQRGFALAGSGPERHDAYTAFEALFGLIAGHCRRDLWFHRCGCGCVSPDELEIVGLIAAQQAGDLASALSSCQSLVVAPAVGEALRLAGVLGRALAERGLALPLRCRYTPWQPESGAGRCH